MFVLPEKINLCLDTIHRSGYEAYIVGGCVRDILSGKKPHDFDITTSAPPDIILNMFEKTVPTGIAHGTVTVIIEGTPIEVTTYRTESGYSDCRHPDKTEFVSNLEQDLARRDFTVNAMAYSHKTGIVDIFGGVKDIENGLLRAVGNPEQRFLEDALRILRLFRFASVLNFKPEAHTLNAALKKAHLLKNISAERIFSELKKCICGFCPEILEPLIKEGGLDFLGIKKAENIKLLSGLDRKKNLRLFSFLLLCGCDIDKTLTLLKASNQEKQYCRILSSICINDSVKNNLNNSSVEIYRDFLEIREKLYNQDVSVKLAELERTEANNEPYKISHLNISGDDLTSIGINGKDVGITLEKLRLAVCENPELNTKEKLKSLVTK